MGERPIPNPAGSPPRGFHEPEGFPGLYIHIPFCIRKCDYCGFYSVTDLTRIPAFRSALRREMALRRDWTASFDTLYWGGGTPSVLSPDDLEGFAADIRTAFTIADDAEVTCETNPGDMTAEFLTAIRRAGVNRLNIGFQSLDDATLALLGRRHDRARALAAFAAAREAGVANIGVDLIYGIPGQRLEPWLATLREAVALNPEHLSCYQLTLDEGTPLAERSKRGEAALPGDALQAEFFWRTAEFLEESGYIHYEVSNFARPGRESRHNRKYWDHTPYLGLGPAAHTFSGRERRWNRRSLDAYIRDLESGHDPVESREILDEEQLRLEALFLGFRTARGICLERFQAWYGRDLIVEKGDWIERLSKEGLLEIRDGFLRPTRAGMAVADSLALI
ncbi:MAG: radical SAM family heme chaperone HemW [Deltaproteobacteria bacterium]|nr:radical SAM family heme chaperone HemW [Deltaproteobacteria bacterium]